MKLPILYKKTNTGKIQQWGVETCGALVVTTYGLVDGKLQVTTDEVKEGKNLGKSNETTIKEQANLQAQQNWDAKIKEGYQEDINKASLGETTLEGIEPMLAFPREKKEKYVKYPMWAQPKLDGLRCIAIIEGGTCRLFSRTRKEFLTVPHIIKELELAFKDHEDIILDGELYNHDFKDDFNKIISLIKRDEVHPESTKIQYHIYDVVSDKPWHVRTKSLKYGLNKTKYCFQHETVEVKSEQELQDYFMDCIARGYEGAILRNKDMIYEQKRSIGLLKVKSFLDDEFEIIGMEEGKGKLQGKCGAFILMTKDGKEFRATPKCTIEQKEQYWIEQDFCIGKVATVQYQGLTPDEKVPRFPVLKSIRDYE